MTTTTDRQPELVVLLDEEGRPTGTADKARVHHQDTPLHLAFSCYLFDERGNVLVTQRAIGKRTFPGVWTNSCCGHPGPGEPMEAAVRRRVEQELGVTPRDLKLVLPRFRYRAEQAGVVENEMCPVFVATVDESLAPDPSEVEATVWEPWRDFRESVISGGREVSTWCRLQVEQMPREPLEAAPAPPTDLPLAAQGVVT
ncbi:isopentenyl-diphosphate Delta-isomerase [Nocardioides oleivorans]|uniref:Isopentenyl-diphosphate Delta-isomerase n=1 Tax=Nocardioides oleivorans TaxID=273676 RepID=A0A4Q2RUN4_9ACTN|nr:isopentenyl-diphosphate Delta-isomerase [Nocardioides oleivorans]RYB91684.1 isopentenyl-diphosphate Delta-isomerase [Nocardioides oleivorans]